MYLYLEDKVVINKQKIQISLINEVQIMWRTMILKYL